MKTIYQLAKVARRLPRIIRKTSNLLQHGRGRKHIPLKGKEFQFEQNRLAGCAQALILLGQEIKSRRIGCTPFRCALPLKKQRAMLAANMTGPVAEKLLAGERLAA